MFASVRVLEALRGSQEKLEIDLQGVSSFRDAALQTLAEVLAIAGPDRVRVRGLTEHQRRILGYLGVQPDHYDAE